jgi:hypothetical protein
VHWSTERLMELKSLTTSMPLTNEIVSSFPNQLLFRQDAQMLCYTNRNIWLLNLMLTSNTIQCHVMIFLLIPVTLYYLRFPPHGRSTADLTEDELAVIPNPGYRSLFDATYCILEKEIRLVSGYVLFAVMYKWLVLTNKDNCITSLNIYQWVIEATWAPVAIAATYVSTPDIHSRDMDDRFAGYYRMGTLIKMPTFIVIRYAETNPSSYINDVIVILFRIICRD